MLYGLKAGYVERKNTWILNLKIIALDIKTETSMSVPLIRYNTCFVSFLHGPYSVKKGQCSTDVTLKYTGCLIKREIMEIFDIFKRMIKDLNLHRIMTRTFYFWLFRLSGSPFFSFHNQHSSFTILSLLLLVLQKVIYYPFM